MGFKGKWLAVVAGCAGFLAGCTSEPRRGPDATLIFECLSGGASYGASYGAAGRVIVVALPEGGVHILRREQPSETISLRPGERCGIRAVPIP